VHRNNILIYIQQDTTLHSLFYLENTLHVLGGTITHYQERKQLYLQHLVFVTPSLLSAAIVGGARHPQHTQTSSNSSMIATDSNSGVTNTRCCRYRCLRSWWWVMVPPETCRAVSKQNKMCNVASCWIYIRIVFPVVSYIFLQCMFQVVSLYVSECSK
jgi:hypothetical protein